jgi:uncharacterized membrane protein YbhN (UPF0104 family)
VDLARANSVSTSCVARRSLLGFLLLAVVAVPAVLGSHRVESQLRLALAQLGAADRQWIAVALLGFAGSLGGAICSWWIVTRSCGARGTRVDAVFRFGVGAVVQILTPARLGDAVRVALFARTVDEDRPVLRVGGAYAMLEGARAVALGVLLLLAWLVAGMSFWPVAIVAAVAVVVVVAVNVCARRTTRGPFARILATAQALRADPRAAGLLLAACLASAVLRVLAASALAAGIGIPSPLLAGLVACCAVDLAGLLPLTPGNVGLAGGAIAVALTARGVGLTDALGLGILFQGCESAVSLSLGLVSLFGLGGMPAGRRRMLVIGVAAAASGAAATLGVTLLV